MITFSILLTLVLIVAFIVALAAGSVIVALGDFIVCGLIIWALVKLFRRKK